VPSFMTRIVVALTRAARSSSHVSQRSGVSVRLSISNTETMVANAVRRTLRTGSDHAVPRVTDLEALTSSTAGKVEIETLEEGREAEILERLVHSAVDATKWMTPRDAAERDREFDLQPGTPAGAMVAQFVSRKGHWVLVHALSILKRRGMRPSIVLFGRGPMRENVAALAEAAGVADQIRFAGFRDDLHEWLGSFDFCVHPALKEGLGVAALQAGAAGVPVVGGRAGGIPEVIDDRRTGILCPPGEAGAVATAIARLLQDPGAARAMGRRARERVESRFSVDAMVEGNLEVYRRVVRARRRAPRETRP